MSVNDLKLTALSFWLGGLMLAVTSLVILVWNVCNDITGVATWIGGILMIASFFLYFGFDKTEGDERARKIGARSATCAWYFTMVFMVTLMATNITNGEEKIDSTRLVAMFVFITTVSMMVANVWYSRKGDAE